MLAPRVFGCHSGGTAAGTFEGLGCSSTVRRLSGEILDVAMTDSLFEVRQRCATVLGVGSLQVALVPASASTDVAQRLSEPELLVDPGELRSDLMAIVMQPEMVVEVGDHLRVATPFREGRDLHVVGDVAVVLERKPAAQSISVSWRRDDLLCKKSDVNEETVRKFLTIARKADPFGHEKLMKRAEDEADFPRFAFLVFVYFLILIVAFYAPLSWYYGSFDDGGKVLWHISLFLPLLSLPCICLCAYDSVEDRKLVYEKEVTFPNIKFNRLVFIKWVSIVFWPTCMIAGWFLADYSKSLADYDVNTRDIDPSDGLVPPEDTNRAPSLSATLRFDVNCSYDSFGMTGHQTAQWCPAYRSLALRPCWSKDGAPSPSTQPAAFAFQYQVVVFDVWQQDLRDRLVEQGSDVSWRDQDVVAMFNPRDSVVNEIWAKQLIGNLTRLPLHVALGSHTFEALDLPASWVDEFFGRIKNEFGIPSEAELPLLWMPESAASALEDYRQTTAKQDGAILRGDMAVKMFYSKSIAYSICAVVSFCFWMAKSQAEVRLRSRIEGIHRRLSAHADV